MYDVDVMPLNNCEFCTNPFSENHILPTSADNILAAFSTLSVLFRKKTLSA
jgi:predicted nucleic acid binding AN1-type Zn finger protein